MNDIQVQALIAFVFPAALQLAKNSQSKLFGWVNQNTQKINIVLSLLASLGTEMGLSFEHTAHSVTIGWTDLPTAIHGLVSFALVALVQFGAQHVAYDSIWRHLLPGSSAPPKA